MDESNVVSYTKLVAVRTAKAMKSRREYVQAIRKSIHENPEVCTQHMCIELINRLEQAVESEDNLLECLLLEKQKTCMLMKKLEEIGNG